MKNKIKYIVLLIFIGAIAFSCVQDDEYTLKEYNPKGGIITPDFSVHCSEYLGSMTEDVTLEFNANRLKNGFSFDLEVTNVTPQSLSSAFSLTETTIQFNAEADTLNVGQINWANLSSGDTVLVTVSIKKSDSFETTDNSESVVIEFTKEELPTLSFTDKTEISYLAKGATENLTGYFVTKVLDKPAEHDIRLTYQPYFNMVHGTQFTIDQELHVAVGSMVDTVYYEIIENQIAPYERATNYIYMEDDDVTDNLLLHSLDGNNNSWVALRTGKQAEFVSLDRKTYSAIHIKDGTLPYQITMTVELTIATTPVLEDLEIPVVIAEDDAQEYLHFLMPEKVIKVKAGKTSGTFEIELLTDNISVGQVLRFWLEIDKAECDARGIYYHAVNYWVTVNPGITEYVATLDQSVTYDVLMDDVSTDSTIVVKLGNVLNKNAPSDLNLPVSFNEWNLQEGVHFNSDGIVRVKSGERTGEITITVIGSAFAGGASNTLWIEFYNADLPTSPSVVRNPTNWWTSLNVGKL